MRHGLVGVDATRFEAAVAGAAEVLETADARHDDAVYLTYTRRIVELMGGSGPAVHAAAKEIFDDWSEHHLFTLYDDVPDALAELRARGFKLGLISNTQRCLVSFQSHFELADLISVAISSSTHGFMKPHPSIFRAALDLMAVTADESVMVGDSLVHDVMGARGAGMRGVLLARGSKSATVDPDVPVIRSLSELPVLLEAHAFRASRSD